MAKKIRHRICKYSECRESFRPDRYGQSCCSVDHAIKHAKELEERKRSREWKERKTEMKEKIKSLSDYKKDLQKLVNEIARLIDKDQPCISCGTRNGKMNGGHFHSVGSNPSIRFNLLNIYQECFQCNNWLSGNLLNYEKGLLETFGEELKEEVKLKLAVLTPELKADKETLRQSIFKAREIIKDLKKDNYTYSNEVRIILRRVANAEMGLYPNEKINN